MKINKIEIQNFYSIKDKVIIDIDKYTGLVVIEGSNKDTGGSNGSGKSLLFEAIVWGLFGKTIRKSVEEALVNNQAKINCQVIIYANDGEIVITRGKKPTSLEFVYKSSDLTGTGVIETQREINRVLGINYTTFLAATVFGQHSDLDFLSANSEDKRTIIRHFLNLESIFELRDKIKDLKSKFITEKKAHTVLIAEYTRSKEDITNKLSKISKDKETYDYSDSLEKLTIEEITSKERERNVVLGKMNLLETDMKKLDLALKEYYIKIEKGNYKKIIKCPECNQDVLKIQTEEDIEKYTYQYNQLKEIQDQKLKESLGLNNRLNEIEIPISSKDLEKFIVFKELCRSEDTYKEIEKNLRDKISSSFNLQKEADKQYNIMKFWERAFSEKGIIKYIIRNILSIFNYRCNYYLDFLSKGKYKISFDEELNEQLKINNETIMYMSLSGGEKRKVNLAILLALQYLLSLSSVQGSNLLFFDEVAENLDADAIDGLTNLLKELKKEKTIFIITHNNILSEKLFGYPKITVIKENGVSQFYK